jgi:hypothetical protein
MKKMLMLTIGAGLVLSSCMPPFLQPTTSPPQVDLQATAVLLAQATVQAQVFPSTPTILSTETPVVASPTITPTSAQPTATPTTAQNSALLTLTATLLAGAPPATATSTLAPGIAATLTPGITVIPFVTSTPTVEPVPIHYGTLPPALPSGTIKLMNESKSQAYISLRCTTKDGYVTILEYPVGGKTINVDAPAGEYAYEAWVGGNQMTGGFRLKGDHLITIKLYESKVVISEK